MLVKPKVSLEARRLTNESVQDIVAWVRDHGEQVLYDKRVYGNGGGVLLMTASGSVVVGPGDWVLLSPYGDFFKMSDERFRGTYDEVEE